MSSPAPPLAAPRLDWMDPARALAIVCVVAYHFQGYAGMAAHVRTDAGVDAFLLLSGFGLAYGARAESTWRFLGRRVWRLLPAYWIALLAFVAVDHLRGLPVDAKQFWLHLTCLHLIAGDPYTLGINDSFWFLGLIVPLYLVFAAVRPWVARPTGTAGYTLLGLLVVAGVVGGWHLTSLAGTWGTMAVGHAPFRPHTLFLGAVAGTMARRRELPGVVERQPALLVCLMLALFVAQYNEWNQVILFTIGGASIVFAGVSMTRAGRRWKSLRPVVVVLTVLGTLSYELFLCHQWVMRTVGDAFVHPYLVAHRPRYSAEARGLTAALLGLAASVPVAYALRWVVAFRDSRSTWRPTLAVVLLATGALAAAGVVVPATMPSARPRTIQLAVKVEDEPPAAGSKAEPILSFGQPHASDLIFLEHDPGGHSARVGIRRGDDPPVYADWAPVESLSAEPWVVSIDERRIEVRAAGQTLRTPKPPHDWRAKVHVGRNEFGFDVAETETTTVSVRRVGKGEE